MGVRSFVIEPQHLFVPALSEMLMNAGLEILKISDNVDLKSILRLRPDVVFGDLDFSTEEPLDIIGTLRSLLPEAIIFIYTARREERWCKLCRQLGANVISKSASPSDIVDGLQQILNSSKALG